ncbi:DUF3800 domain-containing protein [Alteromonas lipolytica]|uniref:DUF3800 domain-containing protein n=1 Tax=Alteromonas lipolytica TaxID=1856405 RepID=A0A1E8FFS1_9ALTE|nr:DUF3800 domain-containing protein [Alteromonas lipolytica]OFI34795.1 hypothetical protein BFC17_14555 [Alteromonas lipolytica]GGF54054.1 hypothetical protein GCM10011338_02780 [Alteromonas lipolytica]
MDISFLRSRIIELGRLQGVDDTYTFFYDETNNVRRLYLTDCGLNVNQPNNFILAGIACRGVSHDSDFDSLFDSLKLQKTAKELKLHQIAKGSFLDMLKSKKLKQVLEWLDVQQYYIHYFNLNVLYWSIIDILDSIIGEANNPLFIRYHLQLKSDFYEIALLNSAEFLKKLADFNYPDVSKEKRDEFCLWTILLSEQHSDVLPVQRSKMLTDLLKTSLTLEELPYISGGHGKELIDDFLVYYLQKLYIFKNSRHIFDEEEHIEQLIAGFPMEYGIKPIMNHQFVKSHHCRGVQVSDVVAGFLGKYFNYLKDTNNEQLMLDLDSLTEYQLATFKALNRILTTSDETSRGFFTVVNTEAERQRHYFVCEKVGY